jgi:predicted permease
LSHRLWERRFGADPRLIGKNVRLDGESYLVAGIMPPGFQFPNAGVDLWTPLALDTSLSDRGEHELLVIARINRAASVESARREIGDLMKRIDIEFRNAGCGADLALLHDWFAGDTRRMFWTLAGAVGLVLLIACANLSNLLLARGTRRAQELAIRSHLGASRGRLIAQLLMESVCLGLMGGSLGLLLSVWGSDLLAALLPGGLTAVFGPAAIDSRVLGYTLSVSLASGLAFGIAPAIRATRLHGGDHQSGARVTKSRLGGTLLVAETALTLILLAGAGLLIRSFQAVYRIDPGFTVDNVLTGRIDLGAQRSENGVAAFFRSYWTG